MILQMHSVTNMRLIGQKQQEMWLSSFGHYENIIFWQRSDGEV